MNLWLVAGGRLRVTDRWGRPNRKIFKEMFTFGNDLFLIAVRNQLLNASQAVIISRLEGTAAAAVWAIATKAFQMATHFVQRIFDFSISALGEMIVRGERQAKVHQVGRLVSRRIAPNAQAPRPDPFSFSLNQLQS
ncbi:hypothetical protein SBV1_590022 [Verrucomicrobia bacterium]|nr:hypothetical protein SBV1_590022 [Verrucomicrobiota bacterium]